ncbi:MAG: hypothetical protein ACR2OO_07100 [Thermomicrobiales bacterium]
MSDQRPPPRRSESRDDWTPPVWTHEPPTAAAQPRGAVLEASQQPRQGVTHTRAGGTVVQMAIAPAITALVAAGAVLVPRLSSRGGMPIGIILLILAQLGGLAIARNQETRAMAMSWASLLAATSVLLPLLAIHAALLREPFVSMARRSATPSLVATLAVAVALAVFAVWSVAAFWRAPDRAALAFMPAGLIVPVMIGMRANVDPRSALAAVAEVALLTALTTGGASLAPAVVRPLAPAIAMGVQFVLLWTTGHGAGFDATSGSVVRWLSMSLLALAVVLTVATPMAAIGVLSRHLGPPVQRRISRSSTRPSAQRRTR